MFLSVLSVRIKPKTYYTVHGNQNRQCVQFKTDRKHRTPKKNWIARFLFHVPCVSNEKTKSVLTQCTMYGFVFVLVYGRMDKTVSVKLKPNMNKKTDSEWKLTRR